ncbi:hypothetical protein NQ318_007680 [Aromia moschata]|uniref:Uncharacterized protein n=1 Tax=Aromia moschata TaxID=1265417 RepID=A0AAV8XKK5_9CUCU|nr:hypothetical protein NQ318_007680 [Aromia moschata]
MMFSSQKENLFVLTLLWLEHREVEQLVNNIKHVAEQFLYHWKTFPIVLPSPVSHMRIIFHFSNIIRRIIR